MENLNEATHQRAVGVKHSRPSAGQCSNAVMFHPQRVAYLIRQFGWRVDHRGVLSRHFQKTIKTELIFLVG